MPPQPERAPGSAELTAEEPAERTAELLDAVEVSPTSAQITLASGRRYQLDADEAGDRVTVRAKNGEIVLRIRVTDEGPVLSFTGAEVELAATRRLDLSAREVTLRSEGDMTIEAGRELNERIGAHHHTRTGGDERVEAASLELQASSGHVAVAAMGKVAIDGEHIGLNDDPLPGPFAWSALNDEEP
jgi:hypothetical protein